MLLLIMYQGHHAKHPWLNDLWAPYTVGNLLAEEIVPIKPLSPARYMIGGSLFSY